MTKQTRRPSAAARATAATRRALPCIHNQTYRAPESVEYSPIVRAIAQSAVCFHPAFDDCRNESKRVAIELLVGAQVRDLVSMPHLGECTVHDLTAAQTAVEKYVGARAKSA